jgi:TrkA domain protein
MRAMTDVEETRLPGVGVRHEFTTTGGRRLGLLTHLSGRRDLLVYDAHDPDTTADTVALGAADVRVLAELLGADHVTERLVGLRQAVRGLEIDWLPVQAGSRSAGRTLGEIGLRSEHDLTPVAVLREAETIPNPGDDFRLAGGDVIVVTGTADAVAGALRRVGDG